MSTESEPSTPGRDAAALITRLNDRTARILVVGQGYVGLPLAVRACAVGFAHVMGFDVDTERIASLIAGRSYVGDISDEELGSAQRRGLVVSSDPADLTAFDVAVITVPTPLREGSPDLRFIESAADLLAEVLRPGALVVLESTTYPGTTTELLVPRLSARSGLTPDQFLAGYSPERIDPGNPTWNLVNTPKVVSGVNDESAAAVDAFYRCLVDRTVPVGNTAEAELVKLLENTYRHVNIALVNEVAMFARDLGADIWRALDACATKPFGFTRFSPGPGVGGHCLPIDPSYLSWEVERRIGRPMRFVELANDVNRAMPSYVFDRVTALLNTRRRSVNGTRVVILGLAYKRATNDWRESPSVAVADRLAQAGAEVVFCDPYVTGLHAKNAPHPIVEWSADTLRNADLVMVLVDHPEFDPAFIAEHAPLVLDTKGLLRHVDFNGEVL